MFASRNFHLPLLLVLPILLASCTGVIPGYEKPQVTIMSFTLAPGSTSVAPRFNIGVRVVNPNRIALPLRGMSYSVEIEGNRVLNGAAPDLPTVAAYDSADFVIEAAPDLLGGARLLSGLLSHQKNSLDYTFRARIDAGGLMSYINVEESGSFALPRAQPR